MEREEEWAKLTSRGSDYDELLRAGYVAAVTDDPDGWRRAIREKARADKLRVRTSVHPGYGTVSAVLLDARAPADPDYRRHHRLRDTVYEGMERATVRGHRVERVIRAENGQAAGVCSDCNARLYMDWRVDPPFMEGEVFDVDCPAADTRS